MRTLIKNYGTAVAICLGLLSLLVAGTGAAVAVTATVVNIADPTSATRIARVDATGHLSVAPAPSTLTSTSSFRNDSVTILSAATQAVMVLTDVRLSETRLNGTTTGSDLTVSLVQLAVDPSGNCTTTPARYLVTTTLSSGLDRDLLGSSRPQLKVPPGQTKYCLGLFSYLTAGGTDVTPFYPYVSWSAYLASGTYAGPGTGASLAATDAPESLPVKKP